MRRADLTTRALAVTVTIAAAVVASPWREHLTQLAAGAGIVLIADLFRVRLTEGRPSSLGLAPGIGLVFLQIPVEVVILAFAAGTMAAHRLRRDRTTVATSLLALACAAVVFRASPEVFLFGAPEGTVPLSMLGVCLAAGTMLLVDASLRALRQPARGNRSRLWTSIRTLAPIHVAIASAGGLFALAEPVLGGWAYLLFLAPIAATQHAFAQLAEIKRTFGQTIDALSKVPELAGYTRQGHAQRVAALAREISIDLGEDTRCVEDVRIAALLHDIGRMRVATPERLLESAPQDLADSGAAVVRATTVLPRVAVIIQRQHEPYRNSLGRVDRTHPLASRIIRVASAYDELTAEGTGAISPGDALSRLAGQAGTEFDPRVIDSLERALERDDVISGSMTA